MRINKSETCNDFSVDLVQSDYGSACDFGVAGDPS
jgi:hypothetical protein